MRNKNNSKKKDYKIIERESKYHRLFALRAGNEAKRVLWIFEKENPKDKRPRKAIDAILEWAKGKRKLEMKEVRKLSLDAHAAARGAKSDSARFAARAAGQSIAIWHAPTHALAVPMYVWKATFVNSIKK